MGNRSGYEDVDVLKDADGCVAIISRRVKNGSYSYAVMREFERDGQIERTSFMGCDAAPAAHRVIDLAVKRIAELEALDAKRAARSAV